MRIVPVWCGASPHGDVEELIMEVDEDGFIRSLGGNVIAWSGWPVNLADPLPNQFPLGNVYKTREEATAAAIATYQGRIAQASASLARLSDNAGAQR